MCYSLKKWRLKSLVIVPKCMFGTKMTQHITQRTLGSGGSVGKNGLFFFLSEIRLRARWTNIWTLPNHCQCWYKSLKLPTENWSCKGISPLSTITTQNMHFMHIHKNMVSPEHWGLAIWLSRSLVWALAENLWGDMRNVHRSRPTNVTDVELFCKEEWANLAMLRCPTQTDSYLKRLSALTKSKVRLISNMVVIKRNFVLLGVFCS